MWRAVAASQRGPDTRRRPNPVAAVEGRSHWRAPASKHGITERRSPTPAPSSSSTPGTPRRAASATRPGPRLRASTRRSPRRDGTWPTVTCRPRPGAWKSRAAVDSRAPSVSRDFRRACANLVRERDAAARADSERQASARHAVAARRPASARLPSPEAPPAAGLPSPALPPPAPVDDATGRRAAQSSAAAGSRAAAAPANSACREAGAAADPSRTIGSGGARARRRSKTRPPEHVQARLRRPTIATRRPSGGWWRPTAARSRARTWRCSDRSSRTCRPTRSAGSSRVSGR